jgi:hypothetical protein
VTPYQSKKYTTQQICDQIGIASKATLYNYLRHEGIEIGWIRTMENRIGRNRRKRQFILSGYFYNLRSLDLYHKYCNNVRPLLLIVIDPSNEVIVGFMTYQRLGRRKRFNEDFYFSDYIPVKFLPTLHL